MARLNVVRHVSAAAVRSQPMDHDSTVLIITGQSSALSCRLPKNQAEFIRNLCSAETNPVQMGFPWHPDFNSPRECEPHILSASWRNGIQFAYAQCSRRFQKGCANLILPRLMAGPSRMVVVSASCGYQIVCTALNQAVELKNDLLLISLGAVGFTTLRNAKVLTYHVRGARDFISAIGSRVRADLVVNGGHMDYWEHPEVQKNCADRVHDFLR
jgi:hypothetical protein